jgi:hypothetical protein
VWCVVCGVAVDAVVDLDAAALDGDNGCWNNNATLGAVGRDETQGQRSRADLVP